MEYLMLMSIILTLFFGLLFYSASIGRIENDAIKIMIEIASVTVIIVSNILAIGMTVWDIYTRQKNIGKRAKKDKNDSLNQEEEEVKEENFDFHFVWRKWNVSSSDDSTMTINQILEDLFSLRRFKRKLFLIQRKGKRLAKNAKVIRNKESSDVKKSKKKFKFFK
jgi:heme/copper-type cytochrome/quinol oxidase subunit 2